MLINIKYLVFPRNEWQRVLKLKCLLSKRRETTDVRAYTDRIRMVKIALPWAQTHSPLYVRARYMSKAEQREATSMPFRLSQSLLAHLGWQRMHHAFLALNVPTTHTLLQTTQWSIILVSQRDRGRVFLSQGSDMDTHETGVDHLWQ